MKHRFWIALALALALTLPAFAEEMSPDNGAESALIIEDTPMEEEAELAVEEAGELPSDEIVPEEAGELLLEEIVPEEAGELLPGDAALVEEEIAVAPPATDAEAAANGAVVNVTKHIFVTQWKELVDAFYRWKGNTYFITIRDDLEYTAHLREIVGKSVTVVLTGHTIDVRKNDLFFIESGGELLLKEGGKIRNANTAVTVDKSSRFTMDSSTITENGLCGVNNKGVFTMKGGTISQSGTGVSNGGTFIADGASNWCQITGNSKGVSSASNTAVAVTVSGRVNITGNTKYDVLLQKGQVVAVGGPLHKDSRIGIKLSSNNLPGPGAPVVVTKGLKDNGTAENFIVWGDYETGINADGELEVRRKVPSTATADAMPLANLSTSGKRALKLSWTKAEGAQGYDVFFGKCGSDAFKKVATVTDGRSHKITRLKKGKTYRACVKAWTMVNGKKTYIGASPTVYAITGGYNNTRCNPKSVKLSKGSLKLKKGRSAKVRARVKGVKPGRKGLHQCKLVRWYSSDRSVAKVNSDGKITAVAKGKCTIYAMANNGVRSSVKVTVK